MAQVIEFPFNRRGGMPAPPGGFSDTDYERSIILDELTEDFISFIRKLMDAGLSTANIAEFMRDQVEVLEGMAEL